MRIFLALLGVLTMYGTFAQAINNTKTEKHQQINGTKFFLVPPVGFTPASSFPGFQQPSSGASIMATEMPAPYSEITKAFTAEGFQTRGIVLKKKEEVTVNGSTGMLITAEQVAGGTTYSKYLLAFGNEKTACLLNGTFPKEMKALDKTILESMLTVVYEAEAIADPIAAAPFTVDLSNTKLKFGLGMTGMLLYTVDGKVPTASPDKTAFIVGLALADVKSLDKKTTSINSLKQRPYKSIKVDESSILPITIDGLSGYEMTAEAIDDTFGKELVYQVMLYNDTEYYIVVGTTNMDYEVNLALFKKAAKTLKRK